jgi:tripartite-type tricarboxylate transporter receptor subunit TctC
MALKATGGMSMRKSSIALAGALCMIAAGVAAEDFPSKTVTLTMPYAAGGPGDTLTRIIGQGMSKVMGRQFVVDNTAGAAGTIGSLKVAQSPPDGYMLLVMHFGHAANIALYRNLRYDAVNDFEPIGLIAESPMAFVGKKGLAANTFQELIDYVKANREKVTQGHAGVGSASHLCGLLFQSATDTKLASAAYRGTGPALNDLAAGVVDAYFGDPATLGIIKSGKARAMAVTSPEPWPPLPDAPPLGSAVAGYEAWNWYGMDAPPGTPQPIVELLAAAIRKVMAEPEVKKKYDDNGLHPATLSHDEYVAFIKRDSEVWGKVIRTGNIKPDD